MTSNDLIRLAEEKGIIIEYSNLNNSGSCAVDLDDFMVIGIDDSEMTEAELKTHLAHELGHCETGAFYNLYSPVDSRLKDEYKANAWAVKQLIPRDELFDAFKRGLVECWQLAEEFSVTEDFVRFACNFYEVSNSY